MTRLACALSVIAVVVMGCDTADPSDLDADLPDGAPIDAQAAMDGAVDSGAIDGAIDDAGAGDAALDAGASDGGRSDGGPPVDGGTGCGPTLGLPCTDACAAGFVCVQDRCVPERAGCGGFAGADCAQPSVHCCVYPSSSSAGICITPEESGCLASRASGEFGICSLRSR